MKLRPFQVGLLAVFGILAFASIILLSNFQAEKTEEELAYGDSVTIWGTEDQASIDRVFLGIMQEDKAFAAVKYRKVDASTFDDELLNAIAEGRSPDMIILPSDKLVSYRSKLVPIPYTTLPERTFRDTYVDGAEIFALHDGVYAVPYGVDPLLMYWNRDIFASNGLAQAPVTWEEVAGNVVPHTTLWDANRDIVQSGIAFGEFRNVFRAQDILLLLALQTGSGGVTETERGYSVDLNRATQGDTTRLPLESSLEFFTNFSDANSAVYSWNRSLPTDTDAFTAGDLAVYFGRGSEAVRLDSKNPNLNFDIAMVPQGAGVTARRTFGTFYGFAILRASKNASGAYAAATRITSAKYANDLTTALNIAPVRRDLVSAGSPDAYRSIMFQSALIARGWLDPDPEASMTIFQQMVEDVVSTRARVNMAVSDAIGRLVLEYKI
jgi:ABC-type glycerol-3-phosphate transport system substrate-binding protein